MLLSRALVVPFLAASALADGNTIIRALKSVTTATTTLGTHVTNWRGDLLGALPIVVGSAELLNSLKHGTQTAKKSSPLGVDEALGVAGEATALSTAVNGTVRALIAAHSRFGHLFLIPVIHAALEIEGGEARHLADAVVEKLSPDFQPVGKAVIKPVLDDLDAAIEAYS